MPTAQHNSLTPEFFSIHMCTPVKLPLTAFYGRITCYSEDQASGESQEYQEIAISRSVARVVDINAYKDHAGDGNE